MRLLSILLVVAGIGVGGATAYFAASRALVEPVPTVSTDEFLSGPQVGSKLPGPFEPLNINGADAGDESCLFCKYGNSPVAMVFTSRPGKGFAELVAQIEKAAAGGKGESGSCFVVTDTAEETKTVLGKLAEKQKLKHVVFGVIDPSKLKHYTLHADAATTVLLYSRQVVRMNWAFKDGELTEKRIQEIAQKTREHFAGE